MRTSASNTRKNRKKKRAEGVKSGSAFYLRYVLPLNVLFLSAVLSLVGCGNKQQAQAAAPANARPAVPVVVAPVEKRDIPVQLTGIGNAEAFRTVQIRS